MLSRGPSSFLDSGNSDDWSVSAALFGDLLDDLDKQQPASPESESIVSVVGDSKIMSETEDEELTSYLSQRKMTRSQVDPRVILKVVTPTCSGRVESQCAETPVSSHLSSSRNSMVSPTPSEKLCMNKNAVAARENRMKKKQFIVDLQNEVKSLSNQNTEIKAVLTEKEKQIKKMESEIAYLRSVIANQTGLSALLNNIHKTAGLNFGTSFTSESLSSSVNKKRKFPTEEENDNNENISILQDSSNLLHGNSKDVKRAKTEDKMKTTADTHEPLTPCSSPELVSSGGVCLHVSNKSVSLEFCSSCASSAAEAWKVSANKRQTRCKTRKRIG